MKARPPSQLEDPATALELLKQVLALVLLLILLLGNSQPARAGSGIVAGAAAPRAGSAFTPAFDAANHHAASCGAGMRTMLPAFPVRGLPA